MRAPRFSNGNTASETLPPTLSKYNGLTLFRLTDVEQTKVSTQARNSQNSERRCYRNTRRYLHQTVGFQDVVKPPAKHASDNVSRLKPAVARFDYLAHTPALDYLINFKRRNVRAAFAHTAAQVRID